MSTDLSKRLIREGLAKGCLGGLGLTVVFLAVSAAAYFLLNRTELPLMLVLFISILCGPIVGTSGLLLIVYGRSRKQLNGLQASQDVSDNTP